LIGESGDAFGTCALSAIAFFLLVAGELVLFVFFEHFSSGADFVVLFFEAFVHPIPCKRRSPA
jgi:hypothetical protein